MKIAVIADIHANLDALRAVLDEAPPVDCWLCAGDAVGYYTDVNEVCLLLREMGVHAVRGNHDAYVCRAFDPDPEKTPRLPHGPDPRSAHAGQSEVASFPAR